MVNFYVVADTSKHVAELQVVHDRMLIARKGLNGHGVYHRSRNALELLVRHFDRNKAAAGDAMALAAVLEGMGGGTNAVGQEGSVESRDTGTPLDYSAASNQVEGEAVFKEKNAKENNPEMTFHRHRIKGHDVFLADKGWLSDQPLKEWMGVTVNERTGRVTGVDLKDKGLVGPIPRELANLAELEHLDMKDIDKQV